ncbi:MAG: hypothetical protein RR482_09605, partial [Clostridia bacterium]
MHGIGAQFPAANVFLAFIKIAGRMVCQCILKRLHRIDDLLFSVLHLYRTSGSILYAVHSQCDAFCIACTNCLSSDLPAT